MHVKVKSATIKSGLFLSYKYDLTGNDVTNANSTSSDAPIHDDLRAAFRNLTPFFAHRTEEITNDDLVQEAIDNPEAHLVRDEDLPEDAVQPFLKYKVTGFTIGGKQDGEGVIIHGYKILADGNPVAFNTPFTKYDSDYKFASDLFEAIEKCKYEVNEYMQGKQAPNNQLSVLGNLEDTEVVIDDI